jgi:hypothetical protein
MATKETYTVSVKCKYLSGSDSFPSCDGVITTAPSYDGVITTAPRSLTVYKKTLKHGRSYLTTLRIPKGTRVRWTPCVGQKCRAEAAFVVSHEPIKPDAAAVVETHSQRNRSFTYKVGKKVTPECGFNQNRCETCASGIHFFLTKEEARKYNFN